MTKVYPNAVAPQIQPPLSAATATSATATSAAATRSPVVLTVWKKSLLFNCNGFTVYNSDGNLVYRVDNYTAGATAEIVLMDAAGRSLLTIRRKRLSLFDNWLVYDGDTAENPLFTVAKHVNLFNTKSIAHVRVTGSKSKKAVYEIEGSYTRRCCVVHDDKRRRVAEIKPKEAVAGVRLGGDVFRLTVQPEIDPTVAMALIVVLDRMFT